MLIEKIGKCAMLEQTAEECTELAKACLKLSRKYRDENPTNKNINELFENLYEEITDVQICINELTSTEFNDYNKMIQISAEKNKKIQERIKELEARYNNEHNDSI